jgi:hypothetical protein
MILLALVCENINLGACQCKQQVVFVAILATKIMDLETYKKQKNK